MAKKYNKNDEPLKNLSALKAEISYDKFPYKSDFIYLCDIVPDKKNEKLEVRSVDADNDKYLKRIGLVYIFVIKNKIFKIGSSTTSIVDRVASYNTGKQKYRMHGTNSTTNYYILQSIINIGEIVNVYALFPGKSEYEILGTRGEDVFPSAKVVEKMILTEFSNKFNRLPIACTQK